MGIENKLLVLKLNKYWQAIDQEVVGKAICDLAAGINSDALDINYSLHNDGTPDFSNPMVRPVSWDEWITLPVRDWDFSISVIEREIQYIDPETGEKTRKLINKIRVPTVLVAKNYVEIPKAKFGKTPSVEQIRLRDGDTCQYTGQKLRREEISIDHVVPRSRGGDNSWTNLVVTHKNINSEKGNRMNHEVGLKLIRPPKVMKEIPRWQLIQKLMHADWQIFLKKDNLQFHPKDN